MSKIAIVWRKPLETGKHPNNFLQKENEHLMLYLAQKHSYSPQLVFPRSIGGFDNENQRQIETKDLGRRHFYLTTI